MSTERNQLSINAGLRDLPNPIQLDETISINSLPEEILLYIFSFNNAQDVCRLGQVCKYWCVLSTDDGLWKTLVNRFLPHLASQGMAANNYRGFFIARTKLPSYFEKGTYTRTVKAEGIKRGPWGTMFSFDDIYACKNRNGNLLVVTTDCIKICNSTSQTSKEKSYELDSLQDRLIGKDNVYITNHSNHEIVVLNSKLEKQHSFPLEDDNNVTSLHQGGNYLAVGFSSGTVKVWDLAKDKCIGTLKSHTHYVDKVFVKEEKIYSISGNKRNVIFISDLSKSSTTHLDLGEGKCIRSILVAEEKIFVSYQKGLTNLSTIEIFDETTHKCLATIPSGLNSVSRLFVEGNVLIAATHLFTRTDATSAARAFNHKTGVPYEWIKESFLDAEHGKMYVLKETSPGNKSIVEHDYNPSVEYRPKSPELAEALGELSLNS
jgi:WD40 repeat protein